VELTHSKELERMNAGDGLRPFGAAVGGGIAVVGFAFLRNGIAANWEFAALFVLIGALVYWVFSGFSVPK